MSCSAVAWPRDDFWRCFHRRAERSSKSHRDRAHHDHSVRRERAVGLVALDGLRTPMFLPVPSSAPKEYSEETARLVDEEIKKVLSEAHAKVRNCLASHKQALGELAKLLLEKEVVERPQLQAILNGADGSCGDRVKDFGHEDQAQVSDDYKH